MVAWAAPKGVNERATSWVRVPLRGLRLSCATLCVGQLHWTKWLASILHTLALQSSPRPRRGHRSELGRKIPLGELAALLYFGRAQLKWRKPCWTRCESSVLCEWHTLGRRIDGVGVAHNPFRHRC